MFQAALETIKPNFPPAVLQSDPRYSNTYYNLSSGNDFRGPWNEGVSPGLGETWQYIEDPLKQVIETNGLLDVQPAGTKRALDSMQKADEKLSKVRSAEVKEVSPPAQNQWSTYLEEEKTK